MTGAVWHDILIVFLIDFKLDFKGLFVSYAYVCAAAKVFEKRESTRELRKLPDFEQGNTVYNKLYSECIVNIKCDILYQYTTW